MNTKKVLPIVKSVFYPVISVNLILDDEGICSACRMQEQFDEITPSFWQQKENKFKELAEWQNQNQQLITIVLCL